MRYLLPLLALLAAPAAAHNLEPGSLLIFPEIDSRPGSLTFVTLTNTSGDANGASVRVHLNYIEASDCETHDASVLLTPRDTLTAISRAHAPSHERGFAYAFATSASGGGPISFNHLVGSTIVLDGTDSVIYGLNPVVLRGLTLEGTSTDVDFDGIRDLDGIEYETVPDRIAVPRFLGQRDDEASPFESELILVGLTGTRFSTSLNFIVYNDNEQGFSAGFTFDCWTRVPLLQISGAFGNDWLKDNTQHAPNEVIGLPYEAGWILIDGGTASSGPFSIGDPAFVAVLVEKGRLQSASLPFGIGAQDNGDLLPTSVFGD